MGIVRKTKSVKEILAFFSTKNEAKSAVQLIEFFKDKMNRTTVYRILDRLVEEGILHSFNGKEGLKWYAKCQGCSSEHHSDVHPHFQCTDCDKVECLPTNIALPNLNNRSIDSVDFFLTGKCATCNS
ncbi:Fur family transcriptional regulator [Polaribacter porphyrae]|uniref:Transcriptional regulator n=1 Tax=Polaribacter porphyrae TaxID=1137780 RepID=A0A2S7WKY6_9FLAO|nr:transcriptional repressor [Polaribacter porphyrae]PQJ77971.1 transcriptional regulator [Polaribacter porphyrae]